MTKLKQVKNSLKTSKNIKAYNNKFKHKQMKFACTKTLLIFNKEVSVEDLVKMEVKLISKEKNEKMFMDSMSFIKKSTSKTIDWNSFGSFLWYLYQTSTYYKDIKKNIDNIYSEKTFIKMNSNKRLAFQKWIDSLDKTDPTYNLKIRSVIKELT